MRSTTESHEHASVADVVDVVDDPAAVVTALAGQDNVFLIGVRHHSPALAVAVPALLDAYRPEVLLLELPAELGEWLPWLADPATVAPVALAGVVGDRGGPAFYPFADFSPELAAVRWAARHGVPVVPCDLPLADPGWRDDLPVAVADDAPSTSDTSPAGEPADAEPAPAALSLAGALRTAASGRADEDMWDRNVEARAPGCAPESVRRAALLVGWAMRRDTEHGTGVSALDLRREAWMRRCLAEVAGRRAAVLVGAFHAPALRAVAPAAGAVAPLNAAPGSNGSTAGATGSAAGSSGTKTGKASAAPKVATSLVPYTFALLDARSGYPAGIRDPHWQQSVFDAAGDPAAIEAAAIGAIVRICAQIRAAGHPSGPAEAREVVRLASDLARLRGLPAPGRGELVEALQSVVAHGEVLGRGRVVAGAMERVLVGERRGVLAPGTPRSGLSPAVHELLSALRLPGPGEPDREIRLDPLRSDLDRRREIALWQLDVCLVPYGTFAAVEGVGGADAITSKWQLEWTPRTDAMLDVAGMRGVTLPQAATGALLAQRREQEAEGGPTARQVIEGLESAARCGLPDLAAVRLAELAVTVPATGSLTDAMAALALLDRLRLGHVAGLARPEGDDEARLSAVVEAIETAAVRQVDGLTGSDDPADAAALMALAQRADAGGVGLRLADALVRLSDDGTPLISAAASGVRVLLSTLPAQALGDRVTSWIDTAVDADSRRVLAGRLAGLLTVAEPLLQAGGVVLEALLERVESLADNDFLPRLPALRAGFGMVSPAGRDRLLATVAERLGTGLRTEDIASVDDTGALLSRLMADRAGRQALVDAGLLPSVPAERDAASTASGEQPADGDATAAASQPTGDEPTGDEPTEGQPTGGQPTEGDRPTAANQPAADDRPPATHDGKAPIDAAAPASAADDRAGDTANGGAVDEDDTAQPHQLSTVDRWRLLLGRASQHMSPSARRYATALDELYGVGRGEGSRADADSRAGQGAAFPNVRDWAEELTALFGPGVREEVLARAAEGGRGDAAMLLDEDEVRPSIDLLQTVLSLAGGMPESAVAQLRPLVKRIVEELTRELATRLRPALNGLATPRPTGRPGGMLDLPRTLRANLATTRRTAEGRVQVIPERPLFKTRAKRSVDWRLVLVVDVSGSMEASVIWSALTASILAGVPALTTHFVAFSTEVVDLTDRVDDPLSLLLEVEVGGGTHIAAGLRYARSLVTIPTRTMVVVVSDFEEGYALGGLLAETRALVESGCTVLGCASLDDESRPRYSVSVAEQLVAAGMPVAALSPLELARWVSEQVN